MPKRNYSDDIKEAVKTKMTTEFFMEDEEEKDTEDTGVEEEEE